MKRHIFICGILVALAVIAVPAAQAGTPVTVRLPVCLGNGFPGTGSGQRTVPAGSEVSLALFWGDRARGLAMKKVDATEVTLAIDGTAIANANSYWGPIERRALFDGSMFWGSEWAYDTGITLENSGDQIVVYASFFATERVRESDPPGWVGPGELLDTYYCTITAK